MSAFNNLITKLKLKLSFSSRDYWENRYATGGNSGAGSYDAHADAKAKVFNKIIEDHGITELIEFGCGDGNQLHYYKISKYLGLDVSKTIVQATARMFRDDPTKEFLLYDPDAFYTNGGIFNAQTSASIDVIFHLVEDKVFEKYMGDVFAAGKDIVIVSSSDVDDKAGSVHVKHRKFTDYVSQHLKAWKLVDQREVQQEDGKRLDDFYVYKRA